MIVTHKQACSIKEMSRPEVAQLKNVFEEVFDKQLTDVFWYEVQTTNQVHTAAQVNKKYKLDKGRMLEFDRAYTGQRVSTTWRRIMDRIKRLCKEDPSYNSLLTLTK